jgi:DNA polymerase III delta prime subunit
MLDTVWDIKYRPKKISDYIFKNEEQQKTIEEWVKQKNFPHLFLNGHRGTGKTSLANMLANECGVDPDDFDYMKINAADDNSVDIIRTRVKNFISGMPVSGDFKIVVLDEFDFFNQNAQKVLCGFMEDPDYAQTVRFILTSNRMHRILPEILSRCHRIDFEAPDKIKMTERFIKILATEKIKIPNLETVQEYIDVYYPDFRSVLIKGYASSKTGTLVPIGNVVSDTTEFMVRIVSHIEEDNWIAARLFLAENVPDDKWDECYRFLYDYLQDIGKFKDKKKFMQGIVVIADHLYKHAIVADPEINFAACLARLSEI